MPHGHAGPNVNAVSPNRLNAGDSGVELSIEGADFGPDATVSFNIPGVTFTQTKPSTPIRIFVTVTVAPGTAPGPRDVVVDNHDGGTDTCTRCFTVLAKGPS